MDTRRQQISERAYAIWEREGRPEGQAERYWHMAEAEIAREMSEPAAAGDKKVAREKKASGAAARSAGKAAKPSPRKRGK
jgi:hypothetical protein